MLRLILLLLFFLTSCSYTYIPPIPSAQRKEPRLEVHTSKGLSYENGDLKLDLFLYNVPEEAWLAVQWFGPLGEEEASASKWVTPESTGQEITFELPKDVGMESGFWRAMVSFQRELIRQFSIEVLELEKPIEVRGGSQSQEEQIIVE